MIVLGEYFTICSVTDCMILKLTFSRSSRLIPGLRGTPEVMTTTSESAVSFQPASSAPAPMIRESDPSIGHASYMSSATPFAFWSAMSMMTTSASSLSAMARATVAPTLPAPPTTVTFRFMELLHGGDHTIAELRALHFGRAVHQPREVVRDGLGRNRPVHPLHHQIRG